VLTTPVDRFGALGFNVARSRAGFFPNCSGLPVQNGRSASTIAVSRPAQASLVLRPADLLTHLSWAWLRGFDEVRYQTPSLVSYPGIPRTPGVGLSPTGDSRRKGARSVAASTISTGEIILTFVNLLHELDADEDAARVVELLEAEHRLNPSFDAPVILLDDVV
jgi:hypothetical protein